jgi:hypothetical protein
VWKNEETCHTRWKKGRRRKKEETYPISSSPPPTLGKPGGERGGDFMWLHRLRTNACMRKLWSTARAT